jgi:16S rRNA C967 or C1407 C5-methylase (RsmB/RsmF family)/NOL1/NOP2/fmu family ribosome biogenesis protein
MPPDSLQPLPLLFLERMRCLLGNEYDDFAAALEQSPVSGLRVNTLKLSAAQFQRISPFALGEPVPWCDSAFNLSPSITPDPSTLTGIPRKDKLLSDSGGSGAVSREPGKHPYHLAGLYYLQDPSAMTPAELLMSAPFDLQEGSISLHPVSAKGMRVLDLAAAPGGKTTALAALMQGHGLLVANEIKDKRVGHLAVNVERWGAGNVVITNESPERLADHFEAIFDRVLLDAPCSGEGMFRKDMGARRDWSPEMVAGCAIRQRNILRLAAKLVRPGGYLLYSTCTFAPEEDEAVIDEFLTKQMGGDGYGQFEVVELPQLPGFMPGRPEWKQETIEDARNKEQRINDDLRGAIRLFPHRVNGDGHFICLLKRMGPTDFKAEGQPDRLANPSTTQQRLWQDFTSEVLRVDFPAERLRVRAERLYFIPEELPDFGFLRVLHPGVWLGTFKKDRFEPAHPLALFLLPGQAKHVLDLPSEETGKRRTSLQAFLSGETIPSAGTPGWTLVTVDGWPLGWGKRVQGILKNHYPHGWQIYS